MSVPSGNSTKRVESLGTLSLICFPHIQMIGGLGQRRKLGEVVFSGVMGATKVGAPNVPPSSSTQQHRYVLELTPTAHSA